MPAPANAANRMAERGETNQRASESIGIAGQLHRRGIGETSTRTNRKGNKRTEHKEGEDGIRNKPSQTAEDQWHKKIKASDPATLLKGPRDRGRFSVRSMKASRSFRPSGWRLRVNLEAVR